MQLTVLGSGTAVPVPDRFPAGYLVEHAEHRIMVDCGPGTLRRLAQTSTTPATLDAVLLTHYHTDHCADLAALLFSLRSPHLNPRPPLTIYGSPGLKRMVQLLTEAWPWLSPKNYELHLVELNPGTFSAHGFEITSIPIRHTAQSLGYRIRAGNGLLALSGDADTCEELVDLGRDADVFVCDSAAPDDLKIDGHLTPGLAGRYAERAGARELLLTHFYPECEGYDLIAEASAHFAGKVTLAVDLMCLPVGNHTVAR